jgi:hypothetical protein
MAGSFDVAVLGSGFAARSRRSCSGRWAARSCSSKRDAPALRDRRVVLSAREPPPRRTLPPLRARRRRGARLVGKLAAAASRYRVRLKRGSPSTATASVSPARRPLGPAAVAASPEDEVADTHWYRPDFDHFAAARPEAGAEYVDRAEVAAVSFGSGGATLATPMAGRASASPGARILVDATGPGGCPSRASVARRPRGPAGDRGPLRISRTPGG